MDDDISSVKQRIRCAAGTHEVRWSPRGPDLVRPMSEADGCQCQKRIDEWTGLGCTPEEVMQWISQGFTSARMAAPWIRRSVGPDAALAWRRTGLSASSAAEWIDGGIGPESRDEWVKTGVDVWTARGLVEAGADPADLLTLRQALECDLDTAARLLEGACGGLDRAHELSSMLDRYPNGGYGDPLVALGRTGYSVATLDRLLIDGLKEIELQALAEAGVEEQELDRWLSLGLRPMLAADARKAGWGLTELREALDHFRRFTELPSPVPIHRPVADADVGRLLAAVDPEQVRRAQLRILDRCRATEQMLADLPSPVAGALREYVDALILEDAFEWFSAGVSGQAAGAFRDRGIGPADAAQWLRSGRVPSDLQGSSPGELASAEPSGSARPSFSSCFTRRAASDCFTVRHSHRHRVLEAVHAMAVPQMVSVQMYGYRREAAAFLDGGLVDRQGYDNWVCWIVGTKAVRLVCARAGINQPARLAGESSPPSVEELEQELSDLAWPVMGPQLDELVTLTDRDGTAQG